jgi:hypothetical protein
MSKKTAISDQQLSDALGVNAGMVAHVLNRPERWLGLDEHPPPSAPFPARAVDAVRNRAFGETTPASPGWCDRPVSQRVDWWRTRIGISAGLAAAAPRFAGAVADRVPLQAALGASAAGLAVCATAREHGRTEPAEWVPLLAKVLFHRELTASMASVPTAEDSKSHLADSGEVAPSPETREKLTRGAQRAASTLWQLARSFMDLQSLFDERPRGNFVFRTVGKVPVVGVAGGWLDERGGIRKSSRQTTKLLV